MMTALYDIAVIDPPWPQQNGGKRKVRPRQGKEFAYDTLTVPGIFDLLDTDIFSRMQPVHCIFLWTIEKFLEVVLDQMKQRGYRRHCIFIWNKLNGIAPSFTIRYAHEYLCWFYQPVLLKIAPLARGMFTTVLKEKPRQHSRKPECSFAMIEILYPMARKIDVFSRSKRAMWYQYGDQTDFYS